MLLRNGQVEGEWMIKESIVHLLLTIWTYFIHFNKYILVSIVKRHLTSLNVSPFLHFRVIVLKKIIPKIAKQEKKNSQRKMEMLNSLNIQTEWNETKHKKCCKRNGKRLQEQKNVDTWKCQIVWTLSAASCNCLWLYNEYYYKLIFSLAMRAKNKSHMLFKAEFKEFHFFYSRCQWIFLKSFKVNQLCM